ncbi:MAG: (2Fe-2S)-binding protein [Xanthobacteraceae bacterium]|nr:(2Fe-2S)-binding protein [Xanthobacteraceae bacterium]MCW5678206.1 (2Fe-2S)-binding protein [Xanthobacteraceae bacterium]
MSTTHELNLTVNGEEWQLSVKGTETLLEVLRKHLTLTGAKPNCLEGECGVCAVLMNGRVVNSCILLAAQCEGAQITTIEGLANGETMHALQTAFLNRGAVQCGYCIPGMIMTAAGYLKENPAPTEEEIREGLCGTLCRCTGYTKIVEAVQEAAQTMGAK